VQEISWIIIGVFSAAFIVLLTYLVQVYVKIRIHKNRIKNILSQIKGQVNIKHDLLREYIEINKDSMEQEKYEDVINKLRLYKSSDDINVNELKDFNEYCNYHLRSFDDNLLLKQCEESEVKINHIKSYYNEVVCFYNNYKSNKLNGVVSKTLDIKDAALY